MGIQNVRRQWSPHAFCVTFKLETDEKILREKVGQAMKKYDVHLVIGNILDTRHEKVSLFEQTKHDCYDEGSRSGSGATSIGDNDDNDDGLKVTEVTKSNPMGGCSDNDDELEENIISNVVEKHFEYIANHYLIHEDNEIGIVDDKENDCDNE